MSDRDKHLERARRFCETDSGRDHEIERLAEQFREVEREIEKRVAEIVRAGDALRGLADYDEMQGATAAWDSATQGIDREPAPAQERIRNAAIRQDGVFVEGEHHAACLRKLADWKINHIGAEQGFVTTHERFVGRVEALTIARAAGQVVHKHQPLDKLLSEDLESAPHAQGETEPDTHDCTHREYDLHCGFCLARRQMALQKGETGGEGE